MFWKSLQALRILGDDLWKKASSENVAKFAKQLRMTKQLVMENELFFEIQDHQSLQHVLRAFSSFEIGKGRLANIYTRSDVESEGYNSGYIPEVIESNRKYKIQYENILATICVSFKQRLTTISDVNKE